MTTSIYAETLIPLQLDHCEGKFRFRCYRDDSGIESIAIASRYFDRSKPVNLRIHSSCITSEVFHSMKCDCRAQLELSLSYIFEHSGLVIYLFQEGRGIGLGDKIRAYALQELGYDTMESNELIGLPGEARSYQQAVDILRDMQISSVNLMTNNPDKIQALETAGISVNDRLAATVNTNEHNRSYLNTKKEKCGHW